MKYHVKAVDLSTDFHSYWLFQSFFFLLFLNMGWIISTFIVNCWSHLNFILCTVLTLNFIGMTWHHYFSLSLFCTNAGVMLIFNNDCFFWSNWQASLEYRCFPKLVALVLVASYMVKGIYYIWLNLILAAETFDLKTCQPCRRDC